MDYTFITIIMLFILWIYFIELSLIEKEFTFSIIQFILALPNVIFFFSNSFLTGTIFNSFVALAIVLASLFIVGYNFIILKKEKED